MEKAKLQKAENKLKITRVYKD